MNVTSSRSKDNTQGEHSEQSDPATASLGEGRGFTSGGARRGVRGSVGMVHPMSTDPIAARKGAPKKKGRTAWKKPAGMPKRPLSAFNLYFRHERRALLGDDLAKEFEITDQSKRKHRKSHGKIGFAEMARLIGERWKKLDDDGRKQFVEQAKVEKERYRKEMQEWKKTCAEEKEKEEANIRKVSPEKPSFDAGTESGRDTPLVAAREHSLTTDESHAIMEAASLGARTTASRLSRRGGHGPSVGAGSSGMMAVRDPLTGNWGAEAYHPRSMSLPGSYPVNFPSQTNYGGFGLPHDMTGLGGSLRGVPGHMEPGSRRHRLQQLYSLHMAEAASLREEIGREAGDVANVGYLQQPNMFPPTYGQHEVASNDVLERTRADLLVLERAAEARRADLVAMERSRGAQFSQSEIREVERIRRLEEQSRKTR